MRWELSFFLLLQNQILLLIKFHLSTGQNGLINLAPFKEASAVVSMDLFWVSFNPFSQSVRGRPRTGRGVFWYEMTGSAEVELSLVFSTPPAYLMTNRNRPWGDTQITAASSMFPSDTNSHTEWLWWLECDYLSLLRGRWGRAKPSCRTITHNCPLNHWVGDNLWCLVRHDFH